MVKVYLSRVGVAFSEHNISIDEQGKKDLFALGRSTTPVTIIGDHVIVGYKPKDLAEAVAALRKEPSQ